MEQALEQTANIFKALSSETRLKIITGLMQKKECNVSIMAEKLNVPQPNISQHLAILRNAGIIEGYRKGTQICYKVTNNFVAKVIQDMEELL